MKNAIGYARVSTEEQAQTNNSLTVQKNKIASYCEQNGLHLVKVFEASESARNAERPVFQEMLEYCRKHSTDISHLIVSDLSRLARNVADQVQTFVMMNQFGIKLVSIDDPITDDSAVGKLSRNMIGMVNQFFSDSLSERTRQRMQMAVKAGRFPWPAPIGYLNVNKELRLDPERAPLVREAFEMIASGRYVTTDAVLKVVTAMGLRTKKGRPLSKQTFARMLSNEIYSGWVVSGDIHVKGTHEAIVSEDVFRTVQTRLNSKAIPHKKLSEDFPLRGVVRCVQCGKMLTAGWAKGRHHSYARYWCWTPGCRAVGISRDDLEGQFVGLLSRMEPTAELLAQLPERIAELWSQRKERIAADAARLSRRLANEKALNQKAVVAKLKEEISADDFDAFKKANAEEIFRIEAEISALDSERSTMEEMLKQAEVQAVDLVAAWEKGNVNQRQELAKAFFPEGLAFSHKKGFFEPANRVITEMLLRWLQDFRNVGVPDGI
jgi:DNA invertase Pin-like site-specific DNA recombinase